MDESELRAIRREVDRRLLWRGLLIGHTVAWIFGSLLALILNENVGLPLAVGWFGVVTLHWIVAGLLEKREKDIQREIERRQGTWADDKRKHDRLYRLSDDGELEEDDGDDWQTAPELEQSKRYE